MITYWMLIVHFALVAVLANHLWRRLDERPPISTAGIILGICFLTIAASILAGGAPLFTAFLAGAVGISWARRHQLKEADPKARKQIILARVAELDQRIEVDQSEKARRIRELEVLQADTHLYGGAENLREYPRRQKKILDKIEAVDRKIEPMRQKRAKLNQELDEIQQKKGYRGH